VTRDAAPQPTSGLAVACDGEGRIVRVVSDSLSLATHVSAGVDFAQLLDAACREKAEAFFSELRRHGAVFNWELTARDREGRLVTLHFAGAASGDGFLVVGARSRSGVARIYEELFGINSERPDALRATMKDLSVGACAQSEREGEFFEELMRLNNELTAAQRELAKKNAELERLNQQKTQWLGITSHDLRNPLEVVMLYSQFLLEDLGDRLDAEHVEFISKIVRSSRFMLELVNDLLDVAKIEAGRLELDLADVDLVELVGHSIQLNQVLAERKEIRILYEPPAAPVPARLDATKIEQVLNNLVGNAVKFSPGGGTIAVRLNVEDEHAVIRVEDEGAGVPVDELDKLFKPFGRTRVRSTGGEKNTGLGLAIVKRIVEGHGGRIGVENGEQHGAVFSVWLPIPGHETHVGAHGF
jgi:signal transduction histidine kinase